MRGKEVVHDQKDLHGGITPAYAGKSDFHDAHLRFFEDHPRLCGEKHILFIIGGDCMGITPAYAGKRLTLHKIWQTVRDHPRLCGEKGAFPVLSHRELGSPPPMRGKGTA